MDDQPAAIPRRPIIGVDDTSRRPRDPAGKFAKGGPGPPMGVPRPKGPSKMTREIKQGIIDAAVQLGEDGRGKGGLTGYLKYLGREHPKQFTSLLGRLLPLQLTSDAALAQAASAVSINIMAAPEGCFLTAEAIAAQYPQLGVIEARPACDGDNVAVAEPAAEDATPLAVSGEDRPQVDEEPAPATDFEVVPLRPRYLRDWGL